MEYPKMLYLKGWDDLSACLMVDGVEAETSARQNGYKNLGEENGLQVEETPQEVKPRGRHRRT